MKSETIDYLEELKHEKMEELQNDISHDFVNDKKLQDIENYYVSDIINEFCDNNVDIYYYDIFEWAKNNFEYVEQSIMEFGDVARDGDNTPDLPRTIQCGQFLKNSNDIYEDIKTISEIMTIDYLLDNDIDCDVVDVGILLDNVDISEHMKFDDVIDYIKEYLKIGDENDDKND